MSFKQWDIEGNYETKGYGMALLAGAKYCRNEKPANYSEENVRQITEKYLAEAPENAEGTISPTNLIVIMNERWADFRIMGSFAQEDSITPYMDQVSENTVKGFLHVPVFGAGTADSEYEVFTGNSMQFLGLGKIYQDYEMLQYNNVFGGKITSDINILREEDNYGIILINNESAKVMPYQIGDSRNGEKSKTAHRD